MTTYRIESTKQITTYDVGASGNAKEPSTAASLVPEPASSFVGDDAVTALAEMLAKLDQQDRTTARETEISADRAQAKEDDAEVQAMHEKADHIRSEGLISGLAAIGEGLCELGAGAFAVSASASESAAKDAAGKALGATDASVRSGFEMTAKTALSAARSDKLVAAVFTGAGKGLDGAGKIGGQQYQAAAMRDDADARSHAASAAAYERTSRRAHDDEMDAREATKRVMSWVKEMREVQNATLNAAASYRA